MLYIGLADRDEIAKVRRAIEERGLTSHMNDTKWRALCTAIAQELPFPPPYQVKLVLSETADPEVLEAAPSYWGDWARTPEASMGIFIEWLKVAPRVSVHMGQLVAPRVDDCSAPLRDILKGLRIPFSEQNGFFTIYGHTASVAIR
ncbi:DUF6678 family protein [Sinorhizobium sojae]|uniref:DUF6678 family protein n=1 Tax=Sinorhizobium sojae TaxID=716925 RepID=UPI0005570B0D|nr:DUF6678 family protein [Sinorhizobium sojae]